MEVRGTVGAMTGKLMASSLYPCSGVLAEISSEEAPFQVQPVCRVKAEQEASKSLELIELDREYMYSVSAQVWLKPTGG